VKLTKMICSVLLGCSILVNTAQADCDWSKIKDNGDGTYTYSKELHLCVGNLVQDNKVKTQQIADLNQAITLKDLALSKENERIKMWMDTSYALEDRLTKIDSLEKKNDWLYFGLGVVTAVGAGYMASKLIHP
jgi:hypothetical protein